MNGKVSIIVPVYNVEKYLEKCIISLLNQSYTDIEILLIDDGSTDGSGEICDKYESKDKRIKVYHKKNGGIASVRNYGIVHACGEFVAFVDSDDYVDYDYIESFVLGAKKYGSNIVLMGHVYEKQQKSIIRKICSQETVLTVQEAVKELLMDKRINSYLWQGLFRKNVLGNIVFPDGENYEDFRSMPDIFLQSNTVTLLPIEKYHYIQRMTSISNNTKRIGQNSFSLFISHVKRTDLSKKFNLKDIVLEMEAKEITSGVCFLVNILKGLFETTEKQYNVVENRLLTNYGILYKNNKLNREYAIKLRIFILLHGAIRVYNNIRGNIKNE